MAHTADVVIVGGGIVGASVAYHLLERDPALRVTLVEREAEVGAGATACASGAVRLQLSAETDVRLVQLSYRYFAESEAVVGRRIDFARHGGLLVTADGATLDRARAAVALQRRLGVPVEVLAPAELGRHLDGLRTDDLVGGTFCVDDGAVDPDGLLRAFLERARDRGLEVLVWQAANGVMRDGDRITGVRTVTERYEAAVVIDCAGAHSHEVAAFAGADLPARPRRHQALVAEPPGGLAEEFPLLVDLDTGLHAQRRGPRAVLLGTAEGDGPDGGGAPGQDTVVNRAALAGVLQAAAHRVPSLAGARVVRAHAGLQAVTPDDRGLLGPVPGAPGLLVACGFGDRGVMHAPAIGRLVAEVVLDGAAHSMDIGPLAPDRFARGRPRTEAPTL